MLPTAYEFHWDQGHIFFLGIFYSVLTVVAATLGYAALRALRDLRRRRAGDIAWHESFADLAAERRHCRHEFAGDLASGDLASCDPAGKVCSHEFACDSCPGHAALAAAGGGSDTSVRRPAAARPGLGERLFHRGHTWVEPRADGTFDVGVDDLLQRCLGRPDRVTVPGVGTRVQAGAAVAELQRGRIRARLASPLTGTVVATADYDGGRLFRVQPLGAVPRLEQLLRAEEARIWMLREFELLQTRLGGPNTVPALADGGEMVDDLMAACPDADWDAIIGDLCLLP
ncbi:MAG: hypothetical protein IPJ24_02425 [bacterium]|nr:hypothetical protein [bacterium]